jgi:hypothetical protein
MGRVTKTPIEEIPVWELTGVVVPEVAVPSRFREYV